MARVPWNKGKKLTEAHKKRISEARKGTRTWNKGKSWSPEVKSKISESKKGQTAWNKGREWPESVKKKISRSKLAATIDIKPYHEGNQPSKRTRFAIFKRDDFRCQYCGRTNKETILEVDHRVPASKGGGAGLDNLITACIDCNRGKADREV